MKQGVIIKKDVQTPRKNMFEELFKYVKSLVKEDET